MPQLLTEISEDEVEKYLTDDNWCAQEKFDGRRKMLFTSLDESPYAANRKGLRVSLDQYAIEELKEFSPGMIMDGEDLGARTVVFDLIKQYAKGMSFKRRYQELESEFADHTEDDLVSLELAETAWTTKEKRSLLKRLQNESGEGIVFKDIRAPYTPGRPASGGSMLKFKFTQSASCVVIGVNKTKRSVSIGLWDPENPESITDVGNVTVYPNQEIPFLGDVIECKYLYAYKGGSLYQPVLLSNRTGEIDESECTLSQLKYKKEES